MISEITGESVRSKREKYTCLELCLSLAGGEPYYFCFYGILFTRVSVRVSVRHNILSAL